MKKTEIQVLINKFLATNPITLTDLFGKTFVFNSYETYITELNWIKNTFKSIPEFVTDTNIYLDRMNKFLDECSALEDSAVPSRINNIRREICGWTWRFKNSRY